MSEQYSDEIEEIKYKCDVVALCAHLGLKRTPGSKSFQCPKGERHSRGDAHPSFIVHPLLRTFECIVCKDVRGDCFKLVMLLKNIKFKQAVEFVGQFNDELENERKKRGMDGYTEERSEVLHNMPDLSIYAPVYSMIWGMAAGVSEFPDLVGLFEGKGISKATLNRYQVVYLADTKEAMSSLMNKYPSSESLIKAGILTVEGSLKFENYGTLIPYFEDGNIIHLQGWDINNEKFAYINPRNDLPVLLNADRLRTLNSGSTVIFTDDAVECMSATELFGENNVLAVAAGARKISGEMLDLCRGMNVKTMISDTEKARAIAGVLRNAKGLEVEIVDLTNEVSISVNSMLRKKKGLL